MRPMANIVSDLPAAFEVIKTLGIASGPASIFAMMWWLERKERIKCYDMRTEFQKEISKAISDTALAINSAANASASVNKALDLLTTFIHAQARK